MRTGMNLLLSLSHIIALFFSTDALCSSENNVYQVDDTSLSKSETICTAPFGYDFSSDAHGPIEYKEFNYIYGRCLEVAPDGENSMLLIKVKGVIRGDVDLNSIISVILRDWHPFLDTNVIIGSFAEIRYKKEDARWISPNSFSTVSWCGCAWCTMLPFNEEQVLAGSEEIKKIFVLIGNERESKRELEILSTFAAGKKSWDNGLVTRALWGAVGNLVSNLPKSEMDALVTELTYLLSTLEQNPRIVKEHTRQVFPFLTSFRYLGDQSLRIRLATLLSRNNGNGKVYEGLCQELLSKQPDASE